jgi:hypothetical protein
MPKLREKDAIQLQLEKEIETIKENAERVREMLIRNNAEDLIPMLLSDLEEITMPTRELVSNPNGGRVRRKR